MLIARVDGKSVDALGSIRGLDYRCPNPECGSPLILKQGRQICHHFAHKSPGFCGWGAGETNEHREAKRILLDSLIQRGLRAELEFIVDTLPGDRRADVMAWRSDNQMVAFELQHSPIPLSEIEVRAESYARAGIAQIWIPFLRPNYMEKAKLEPGGLVIERYPARPFERWVYGLHGDDGMWMYDPKGKSIWLGFMKPTQLYVQESSWYGEGGEEMNSGGYYYDSKKYCDLDLYGPFQLPKLMIRLAKRESFQSPIYNWPAGKIASFVRSTAE